MEPIIYSYGIKKCCDTQKKLSVDLQDPSMLDKYKVYETISIINSYTVPQNLILKREDKTANMARGILALSTIICAISNIIYLFDYFGFYPFSYYQWNWLYAILFCTVGTYITVNESKDEIYYYEFPYFNEEVKEKIFDELGKIGIIVEEEEYQ